MNAARVALGSAITAAVAWGLKAVAIGLAGGLDQSPLEGPLFLVGLVAISVAFAWPSAWPSLGNVPWRPRSSAASSAW